MSTRTAASLGLGLAFATIAFVGRGGTELGRTTAVVVALLVAGGAVVALAVLHAPRGPLHGGLTLAGFAALLAVTALSIRWSIAPDLSWIEANRTFAYTAALAAGVAAARLDPRGAPVLANGLVVGATIIVGYGLASRVWPTALAPLEIYARIGQPYGYWNALGTTAAVALPPVLWLGARRSGHLPLNALAYPLAALMLVALALTFSRGALAAGLVGVVLWLVVAPLRLRSLTVLAVAVAGAVPVIAWALDQPAFTQDGVPAATRELAGASFGVALLATMVILLIVGLLIGFATGTQAPTVSVRRRAGLAAVAVACAVPLVGFTSVALSERGLVGTAGDRVAQLRSPSAATPGGPERLASASSSRAFYWSQAEAIYRSRPNAGTGAGTYGLARLRYRPNQLASRHAHGFFAQTLADLGRAGTAAAIAFLLAALVAALRATGLHPWARGRHFDAQRVALVAVGLAALVFGLQSAIDWTWFVPAPTTAALVALGFVVGRGPLTQRTGPAARGAARGRVSWTETVIASPAGAFGPERSARWSDAANATVVLPGAVALDQADPADPVAAEAAFRADRHRRLAAGAVLGVALLGAWSAWQPYRADRTADRALELLAARSFDPAAATARRAALIDPVAPKPVLAQAAIEAAAGRPQAALELHESAVRRFPNDPQVWIELAEFQLERLGRPAAALDTLRGALYLDPQSKEARRLFLEARARQRTAATATPAPATPPTTPGAAAPNPVPSPTTPTPTAPAPTPPAPTTPSPAPTTPNLAPVTPNPAPTTPGAGD